MDENSAFSRIKQRDQVGLEALMNEYGRLILRVIRQILGPEKSSEIEECASDVWMTVWQRAESFDSHKSSLKTWLCMIARSKAIDRLRRFFSPIRNAYSLDDERLTDLQHEMIEMPELLEEREEIEQRVFYLNQALALLTSKERSILIRRYFYYEEIIDLAKSFGVSRAAMDNHLSRSRKKLRELYLEAKKQWIQ